MYCLDHTLKTNAGVEQRLDEYLGKVVLIVNVASECGLTPQYEALQALHDKYGGRGLVILGFPCNQFGGQEPGTAEEILQFCSTKYHVTFPLFAKLEVNGQGADALYQQLTALEVGPAEKGPIRWNFEKFLVDRRGHVVARFAPTTRPDDPALLARLEQELDVE
ncbi:MAG TPA: glutathione peroxidase [Pirellulaceae bacterium]